MGLKLTMYKLKVNADGQSDVRKQSSLVYKICDGKDKELKYFCACSKCFKVYQYKDNSRKHSKTLSISLSYTSGRF